MSSFVYLLEMVVQTLEGIINEPIGIYTTEQECNKWLNEAQKTFDDNVVFNVLPIELDKKPPILDISKSLTDKGIAFQLIELYNKDVFEQMVEPDGTFCYQLKGKYKSALEKIISKRFDELK